MWPQTATWATRVTCLREPDYVPLPGGAEEQQGRAPQVDMLGHHGVCRWKAEFSAPGMGLILGNVPDIEEQFQPNRSPFPHLQC